MKTRIFLALFLGIFILINSACSPSSKNKSALDSLFSDFKEYSLRRNPVSATYDGDHRFDSLLADLSDKAMKNHYDSLRIYVQRAKALDGSSYTAQDSLSLQLFIDDIKQSLEGEQFHFHYMPLTQQDGIHIEFPQIIEIQPFATETDFLNYKKRLEAFPKQVDDIIANMKLGITSSIVLPAFAVQQILDQIQPFITQPLDSLPFYRPLYSIPSSISKSKQEHIIQDITIAIGIKVIPAYMKLAAFLEHDYAPHARTLDGVYSLPNGKERYAYAIRVQTTTDKTPEEIYSLGLKEVTRINAEMQNLLSTIGYKGSLSDFKKELIKDPSNSYTTKDPMMKEYRRILSLVDKQLPSLFGRLPKSPYDLKEIEPYRAISAPQAYYYSAPLDRSRPGYFYVNTYDLASRPKHTMTALALHEAVPGHHLQIAIAQELPNMPWFRLQLQHNAFVEGWALYAESLGYTMKLYNDPYQHFGALAFEMFRACRLVIDAGIHTGKMNREEAVRYMLANTGNSELDARSEVDRYIVWPGQALAYKIGQITILSLREKAQKALGDTFSLSAFHDAILGNGPLPLNTLSMHIDSWIASHND